MYRICWSLAVFCLLGASAFAGTAPALCEGHNISPELAVLAGNDGDPTGNYGIRVECRIDGTKVLAVEEGEEPVSIGPVFPNELVLFEVTAEDYDWHVCKIPSQQFEVANYILNSEDIKVTIKDLETGAALDTIALPTVSGDGKVFMRKWAATWTVPKAFDVKTRLAFYFDGTVDDMKCETPYWNKRTKKWEKRHIDADDKPVKLSGTEGVGTFWAKSDALAVKVTKVPTYLFASAQYATPISFKVIARPWDGQEGMIDKVYLDRVFAVFCVGDNQLSLLNVTNRLVGGANWDLANGDTSEYTCFFKADSYNNVALDGYKTDQARFELWTQVARNKDGVAAACNTDRTQGEDGRIPSFADRRILAMDMVPTSQVHLRQVDLRQGTQGEMDLPGDVKYSLTRLDDPTEHPSLPQTVPSSLTKEQAAYIMDYITVGAGSRHNGIFAHAELIDEEGQPKDAPVATVRARCYGKRLGGYFYISYPGRDSNVLNGHERAMDLSREDYRGTYDLQAFSECTLTIDNDSGNTPGLGLSGLAAALFSAQWAIAATPWTIAIAGTASAICGAIASIEFQGDLNRHAEGAGSRVVIQANPRLGSGPFSARTDVFAKTTHSLPGKMSSPLALNMVDENCYVGEQVVFFIELDSCVSMLTAGSANDGDYQISNDVSFSSNNASDLRTFSVAVKE
jgi:hypothetical protein